MHLRIATYNIHSCIGADGIEDFPRIVAVLQEIDADIIALQEVAAHHEPAKDMLAYLARNIQMKPIEGFTLSAAGAHYGNALLTRIPVSKVKRMDISVAGREPRGVIEAAFEVHHHRFVLWATHLGLGIRERRRQIKKLLDIVEDTVAEGTILLGDFNEWLSWSRPLRAIHRWFTATQSPATFPARRPLFRLDRIWIRPAERLSALRVHSSELSRVASDHLPLVADLEFR